MAPTLRDREDAAYDKPRNYDEMVRAAQAAAQAARAAGGNFDTVKLSAQTAAFQVAGLKPKDDPWTARHDLS